MIRRKSEGNKEKSVCPTLARKTKNPKLWRIWKEKGREGRAGVILSAPQHTRGNRADRGETRSGLHRGREGPASAARPRPPSAVGQSGRRAWPPSRSSSSPLGPAQGRLQGGSARRGAPGRASPQSSPAAEADPPRRAQGSGCSWSYRQVWQKLKNPKERHTG